MTSPTSPTTSGAGLGTEHLEPAALGILRDEVGDQRLVGFIKAFQIMLDERLERIERLEPFGPADPDLASDALRAERDLRVSSEMLGAQRLAELLFALDAPLRTGRPAPLLQLAAVRAEAEAVDAALSLVVEEAERRL